MKKLLVIALLACLVAACNNDYPTNKPGDEIRASHK
jgi:hypothetical protein